VCEGRFDGFEAGMLETLQREKKRLELSMIDSVFPSVIIALIADYCVCFNGFNHCWFNVIMGHIRYATHHKLERWQHLGKLIDLCEDAHPRDRQNGWIHFPGLMDGMFDSTHFKHWKPIAN